MMTYLIMPYTCAKMVHFRAQNTVYKCQREHPKGGGKDTRRPKRQVPWEARKRNTRRRLFLATEGGRSSQTSSLYKKRYWRRPTRAFGKGSRGILDTWPNVQGEWLFPSVEDGRHKSYARGSENAPSMWESSCNNNDNW